MDLNITIGLDRAIGCYTIEANGEVQMECLSLDDVRNMTIADILTCLPDDALEKMEEVNEEKMCRILGEMSDYVNEAFESWGISGAFYLDDCEWGNDCFKIKIFDSYGHFNDDFFFRYDRQDLDGRDCYEQAYEKVSDWLEKWNENRE